jgi:hypothetical protein
MEESGFSVGNEYYGVFFQLNSLVSGNDNA